MLDRLARSWSLARASAAVLAQDKELLLFPLCSAVSLGFVMLAFLVPAFGLGMLDGVTGSDGSVRPAAWALGFLFYFVQYFVIFFFNAGLVGTAMIRLGGGTPTFRQGLRMASAKVVPIAGYAAIAATVGMVLRVIQERVGFVGRIIVGLLGAGWTLATFLVVPVLVAGDDGPVEAVKRSAHMMKRTWGENLAGNVGLGFAGFVAALAVVACGVVGVGFAALVRSPVLGAMMVALTVLALVLVALVQSALAGIYAAALYRYALGKDSEGFEKTTLELAFAPK